MKNGLEKHVVYKALLQRKGDKSEETNEHTSEKKKRGKRKTHRPFDFIKAEAAYAVKVKVKIPGKKGVNGVRKLCSQHQSSQNVVDGKSVLIMLKRKGSILLMK